MNRSALLLSTVLALCAVGCINPPTAKPPAPQDYYYHATPERVWNALLLIYTDLNIPIANMDRASWFMRSQDMVGAGDSTWVDCGTDAYGHQLAATTNPSMSVTTLLRATADSTAMRLNVNVGVANVSTVGGSVPVQCVSKGVLERRVVELVRQRL